MASFTVATCQMFLLVLLCAVLATVSLFRSAGQLINEYLSFRNFADPDNFITVVEPNWEDISHRVLNNARRRELDCKKAAEEMPPILDFKEWAS